MKDLYARNSLQPLESNLVKIHNCKSDLPEDSEAAFAILLNRERKLEYDKLFVTMQTIAKLRHQFNLNDSNGWRSRFSDFVLDPEKIQTSASVSSKKEEPKKSNFTKLNYLAVGAGTIALMVVSFIFNAPADNTHQAEQAISNGEQVTILKHAIADKVPIRDAPNEMAKIVYTLDLFEDIRVTAGANNKGWDSIKFRGKDAFVYSKNLVNGSGYPDYLQHCRSAATPKPQHGEALFHTASGPHSLVIVNPPGQDAVVKLKDTDNHDVLAYYVYGGNTLTLDDIPEGRYSFWYAVGDNYNLGCGHFIDNVRAWREQETVNFRARMEDQLQYTTSHVLSLKNSLSDAQPIDLRYF